MVRGIGSKPWELREFAPDEASRWRAAGFRADAAFLLRSLGATPTIGKQLLRVLGDEESVVEAVERAMIRPPGSSPRSAAEVAEALDALVAMTACGFRPHEAKAWISGDWDAQEAARWAEAGFGPASARAWRAAGFAPKEAVPWKRDLFGAKQAAQWRRLGATPERARAVAASLTREQLDVVDALRLLDLGLTVEDLLAGRREPPPLDLRTPPAPSAPRLATAFSRVPVAREDLLAAAGQLVRAGTASSLVRTLQAAADAGCRELEPEVVAAAIVELRKLDDNGALGSPLLVRIVMSRFDRALAACTSVGATAIPVERTPVPAHR